MGCPRCAGPLERLVREESTLAAPDPDFQGVGSSPYKGDYDGWQFIPQAVPEDGSRYLYRLTSLDVPGGDTWFIVNLRTGLTIADPELVQPDVGNDEWTFVWEREVVSPYWRFQDSSVSWHLMSIPGAPDRLPGPTSDEPSPGTSTFPFNAPPAQLVNPDGTPLSGGQVFGNPISGYGTIRDKRFPWYQQNHNLINYPIIGPQTVILYASVKQTDPATRPVFVVPDDPAEQVAMALGLAVEDQFLIKHPLARYRHIAGSITYERIQSLVCAPCGGCVRCCRCEKKRLKKARKERSK